MYEHDLTPECVGCGCFTDRWERNDFTGREVPYCADCAEHGSSPTAKIASLRAEVTDLRAEIASLRAYVERLRGGQ